MLWWFCFIQIICFFIFNPIYNYVFHHFTSKNYVTTVLIKYIFLKILFLKNIIKNILKKLNFKNRKNYYSTEHTSCLKVHVHPLILFTKEILIMLFQTTVGASPKFARDGVTNTGPTNFQWINGPGTVDRFRKRKRKGRGKLHKSLQSLCVISIRSQPFLFFVSIKFPIY